MLNEIIFYHIGLTPLSHNIKRNKGRESVKSPAWFIQLLEAMIPGYPDCLVICGGFPSDSTIPMVKGFVLMVKKTCCYPFFILQISVSKAKSEVMNEKREVK